MNKLLLLAMLCFFGIQSVSFAQEPTSTTTSASSENKDFGKRRFYLGGGVALRDYKLNNKLASSNLPEINNGVFELTIGYNRTWEKYLLDVEWNTDYYGDKRTEGQKVTTIGSGLKLRFHYAPYKTEKTILSGGLDVSYMYNTVNIFTRGNTIDLNNLNPDTHTGHISLYNNLFYVGPSVNFGVGQNRNNPLRLIAGYEWAVSNGKWKSEYASVANTVKENGNGRFYAKVIWYL